MKSWLTVQTATFVEGNGALRFEGTFKSMQVVLSSHIRNVLIIGSRLLASEVLAFSLVGLQLLQVALNFKDFLLATTVMAMSQLKIIPTQFFLKHTLSPMIADSPFFPIEHQHPSHSANASR